MSEGRPVADGSSRLLLFDVLLDGNVKPSYCVQPARGIEASRPTGCFFCWVNMRAKLIVILLCTCLMTTLVLIAQDIPSDELFWGSRPYVPEIANAPAIRVQSDLVEVATV